MTKETGSFVTVHYSIGRKPPQLCPHSPVPRTLLPKLFQDALDCRIFNRGPGSRLGGGLIAASNPLQVFAREAVPELVEGRGRDFFERRSFAVKSCHVVRYLVASAQKDEPTAEDELFIMM